MSDILDEESTGLLIKHNIPIELAQIIADDAIRIALDDRRPIEKGIIFCSKDDGKLFAITRCIDKIRKTNDVYSKPLDERGSVIYVSGPINGVLGRNEQIIDLDNLNIEEEKKKSVFRYANSFIENGVLIGNLNTQIANLDKSGATIAEIDKKIENFTGITERYKQKIAEIETSIIPNVFRTKKLNGYRSALNEYQNELEEAKGLREEAIDVSVAEQVLITPRKKRIERINSFNGMITQRIKGLMEQYGINQEEIKEYLSTYPHNVQISEELFRSLLKPTREREEGRE